MQEFWTFDRERSSGAADAGSGDRCVAAEGLWSPGMRTLACVLMRVQKWAIH